MAEEFHRKNSKMWQKDRDTIWNYNSLVHEYDINVSVIGIFMNKVFNKVWDRLVGDVSTNDNMPTITLTLINYYFITYYELVITQSKDCF